MSKKFGVKLNNVFVNHPNIQGTVFHSEPLRRELARAICERDLLIYNCAANLFNHQAVCGRVTEFIMQPNDTVALIVEPFGPQSTTLTDTLTGINANLAMFNMVVLTQQTGGCGSEHCQCRKDELLSVNAIQLSFPDSTVEDVPPTNLADITATVSTIRQAMQTQLGGNVTITEITQEGPKFRLHTKQYDGTQPK